MNVSKHYHIETIRSDDNQTVHEHIVEIGTSSWDDKVMAIRNRWDTNGRFSPHSSSEVTPEDALLLAAVAIIRWIVFYVNRAGKSLPEHRRVICHAAIRKLQRLNRSLQSRNRS